MRSTQGGKLKLSSFQGKKNVLIEFYVLDCHLNRGIVVQSGRLCEFPRRGYGVIGISAYLTFSQQAFADFLKLNFPLVSDYPDLKTIDTYGVLDQERRLAQRSYFIVDKKVLFVTRTS